MKQCYLHPCCCQESEEVLGALVGREELGEGQAEGEMLWDPVPPVWLSWERQQESRTAVSQDLEVKYGFFYSARGLLVVLLQPVAQRLWGPKSV